MNTNMRLRKHNLNTPSRVDTSSRVNGRSNPVKDPLVEKAHIMMNKIAKKITYYGGNVDQDYPDNKNRYFKPSGGCCSKFMSAFGYEVQYEKKVNNNHLPGGANMLFQAQKVILDFIWGGFSYEGKKGSKWLNAEKLELVRFAMKMFIDTNEGTCSEQCIMLMFALLDDNTNNIRHGDIGLIFLENHNAITRSYDKNHERHFLLRVKDYYFDPLTNTSYDKEEASALGLNSDYSNFKIRGLKDEYSVNKRLTLTKEALDIIKSTQEKFGAGTATYLDR